MRNKYGSVTGRDFRHIVEPIAHQRANRKPGEPSFRDTRHAGKRAKKNQGPMVLSAGQVHSHTPAERFAMQYALGFRNLLLVSQPRVCGIGSRITACLTRTARALAVAWIVKNQDRQADTILPFANPTNSVTEIAGIAVTIKHGALVR